MNTTRKIDGDVLKLLDLCWVSVQFLLCMQFLLCIFPEAVEDLCVYASSSEFVTIPAKISPQAREAQKPIVGAGNRLIDSSCSVISSAKNLIVMPKDPSTWQQFAKCSKEVSDSMKHLVVNIR